MKLAELYDMVESNVAQAARDQKTYYDSHTSARIFKKKRDPVWLSIATAGKLECRCRCEGRWIIKSIKSPLNFEITDGERTRVVHINRLQHRIQPMEQPITETNMSHSEYNLTQEWIAPEVYRPHADCYTGC